MAVCPAIQCDLKGVVLWGEIGAAVGALALGLGVVGHGFLGAARVAPGRGWMCQCIAQVQLYMLLRLMLILM